MHTFSKAALVAAVASACFVCSPTDAAAQAVVLLEDNFDSYTTQAEFEAQWTLVGETPTGTLSEVQSKSAPKSVNYGTTAQRNENVFGEPQIFGDDVFRFSFDFFDSNAALQPYRQYGNLQDSPGLATGQLVSMGLNNNQTSAQNGGNFYMARILGYQPDDVDAAGNRLASGAYFKLNNLGSPTRTTGWHNLAVDISATEFRFYVDGVLSKTIPQFAGVTEPRKYDTVRLGSGLSSSAEAYFDNVFVALNADPIPEPSATFLGLLATGLLFGRRRAGITI